MNITVNTTLLAVELRLLVKALPNKTPMLILSHVLLRAADDTLTLMTTDIEVGISATCPARVSVAGELALPAKTLLDLVESLPDGDVTICLEGKRARVSSGGFKSHLQALMTFDFPVFPEPNGAAVSVANDVINGLITRTRYAISDTDQKHVIKGALLTTSGASLVMVATDGKRLSFATAFCGEQLPTFSEILPMRLLGVLPYLPGDMAFSVGEKHLFFVAGTRFLYSRMMEGKFPDYARIIPKANHAAVGIDRASFMALLKRVLLVASDTKAVYLSFEDRRMTVSASSVAIGEAAEAMAVDYTDLPIKVCVSGASALDFLTAATAAQVTLRMKDASTPVVLEDGETFTNVLLVMKT